MKSKKILTIIILLLAVMIFSVGMIVKEADERRQDISDFEKLEDLITEPESEEPVTDNENTTEPVSAQSLRNLTPLFEQNADCLGWICIPDTSVNYPVMHTPQEPEKYLRRNFEGEYSVSGVPFLEGTSLLNDTNLIIYGHNMKNGTMFSDVTKYREKDFCGKHPYIEFETKDGLKCYDVFAVVCVKKTDNWYKFSYAENEEQYRDKITEIKKRSLYDTGIVPEYGQQLITLSTCYGNAKDDRIIVMGAEQKESSRIAS